MEIIIVNSLFVLSNLFFAVWNYKKENYKTSILGGFAAGVCFATVMLDLLNTSINANGNGYVVVADY